MVLVVPRTDSGGWGAGLAYGAAVLVLALLQPPRLLADLPVGRVLAAAVLGTATAAVYGIGPREQP
ncbi:hypothetical protein [Cellulomonas timonensis]|uniref:hypothetical protein n=1 Tax=Cellulomonas timonensis TaxID=1689271 RepID=UPI00082AEE8F|nr:hypothetical protein [Cellulomonas timonensis]